MARNILETIMGAIVLLVAGGFLVFAYERSAVKEVNGYGITARFSDVSGIGQGSDVRIGGLKIGVVDSMILDAESYQAELALEIQNEIKLPKDSSAAVVSSGLLGDKFIKIEPGGSDKMLDEGDAIRFTQSSISFEELIGKFVFSGGGVGGGDDKGKPAAKEPAEEEKEEKSNPFSLGL